MVVFIGLILLEILSIALLAATIRKLYTYINKYKFDESVYTLLFGFVRLRWFVSIYIFMIAANSILGVLFAFSMTSA